MTAGWRKVRRVAALAAAVAAAGAAAQSGTKAGEPDASAPAQAASAPVAPLPTPPSMPAAPGNVGVQAEPPREAAVPDAAAAPPDAPQRIEVTGGRVSDAEGRRQSTTTKIVIGRDDIERYGDGTVGELLKRLPGVTVTGPSGRGGAPRMRGLGSGYTQILLDGEPLPRGFSVDSISPEQVERIEVLRAPTAETGTRAIAGTINIVLREAYRRRLNELRLAVGGENGRVEPSLNWTRNDTAGDLTYNVFASLYRNDQDSESTTVTVDEPLAGGDPVRVWQEHVLARSQRQGARLGGRLQWRLQEGESLVVSPFVIRSLGQSQARSTLEQAVGLTPPPYARSATDGESDFSFGRLNAQWRRLLADGTRVEWSGTGWQARSSSDSLRDEFNPDDSLARRIDDSLSARERLLSVTGKASRLLENDHSLVAGVELEGRHRTEDRLTLQDGVELLPEFGDSVQARSTRVAAYVQDEWQWTPNWSLYAGLRWEGIDTRGYVPVDGENRDNRSSVWSPLFQAVWKPEPKSRDQVRLALTRSYRSPSLQNLISRPVLSSQFPVPGPNDPTSPDRAGNPDLKPELATGLDLAFERYLGAGGVLSANLFHRRISNYIRNVTTLEQVSWSDVPRWVSRPQNIGSATTQGIELEAKLRASDLWPDAPRIDLRANASVFRSSVDDVPGPDNRLDEQPDFTANLGADWRPGGWPLTIGGNVNVTPGYLTVLSPTERVEVSRKRVFDAYALWTVDPIMQWRLSVGNIDPLDNVSTRSVDTALLRETATTTARSYLSWQLRLEMKL